MNKNTEVHLKDSKNISKIDWNEEKERDENRVSQSPLNQADIPRVITMSETERLRAEDIADENKEVQPEEIEGIERKSIRNTMDTISQSETSGNDSDGNEYINTLEAPYHHPSNQGEQSVSGSASDPSSDDDTLQNAQDMGFQLEEDEEHPEELDMARDIDRAEEYIRNH